MNSYELWLGAARANFPFLTAVNSRPTSPFDPSYNCIAWAAGRSDAWWWPDPLGVSYWPTGVNRSATLQSFLEAYAQLGYTLRSTESLEAGVGKVAVFVSSTGIPTHAARQLPSGWWASKLGRDIDIEHELRAVEGPVYGTVGEILSTT